MTTEQPSSRPQAPDTRGRLRRLLGDYHVTGVFWYRFHQRSLQWLPGWAVGPIIGIFTSFFFVALRRIRAAIAANLVPVLGPAGWWRRQSRIFRTMHNLAWCLTERYEGLDGALTLEAEVEGSDDWRALKESGTGMIVVTAHIGHWEVGSSLPALRENQVVHVIRESEVDPKAQEMIRTMMAKVSDGRFQVHFADESDTAFGARLLSALRDGDIVALQGDRPRAGGQTVTTTLFGRDFTVPAGPAALARAAQVPLVPVFIFREGRARSLVWVRPPITVRRSADRAGDLREAMQGITSEVERAIRFRPHQWFCFRKVFTDDRAAGEDVPGPATGTGA